MKDSMFACQFYARRAVAVFVAALIAWAVVAVSSSQAQTAAQRYDAAVQTFNQMIAAAQQRGQMPLLSDPKVATVLAIITDQDRLYGTPAFPVNLVTSTCFPAIKAYMSYATFVDRATQQQAQQRGLSRERILTLAVEKNSIIYQDELILLQNFSIRCNAAVEPSVSRLLTSVRPDQLTAIQHQSLVQLRNSAITTITGVLIFVSDKEIKPQHRKSSIATLKQEMPALIKMLTPSDRNILQQRMSQALAATPRAQRAAYDPLFAIVKNAPCTDVCTIP
jgi:hypothetical protein